MGNSQPHLQSRRTSRTSSFNRKSSDMIEIIKKINEKECTFIAMQSEIDKAIIENNKDAMKSLTSEIAAHIFDLNQLKHIELASTNRGRVQKIIYNFELSLAKLKSIYNYDTAMKKERDRHFSSTGSSSFYVERADSVQPDLIRFDGANSVYRSTYREPSSALPDVPENEINHQSSRSNSLYSNQPQTSEEAFLTIESEFDVLKDQAQRPVEDVNEYYQMDKGVFYLYVKVKNLEFPEEPMLNDRKLNLIKDLAEFRTLLDRKSGELEEHRDIDQETNTLELLLDSASDYEFADLRRRALVLQERVERSSWDPYLAQRKIELLRRIGRFIERIAYTSPSSSLGNSGDHIYGNLNSLQEQIEALKSEEDTSTAYSKLADKGSDLTHYEDNDNLSIKDENDESIYGNVDIIRQNIGIQNSQRNTVYINADIVKQADAYENHVLQFEDGKMNREVIAKRPLPLPRNYDDKVINDLPKYWHRLNEIFEKECFSDTDKSEVADIQKHAEVAKSLFERKIKRIVEKFEDSVEL